MPKRKAAPSGGGGWGGAKKRTPGKVCSQSLLRPPVAVLPRNLEDRDRRELRPRESRVDGRESHAATAAAPDQHPRHRRPHARDTLRLGKNQRHCGSRHHGPIRSNPRASAGAREKSGTWMRRVGTRAAEVTCYVRK